MKNFKYEKRNIDGREVFVVKVTEEDIDKYGFDEIEKNILEQDKGSESEGYVFSEDDIETISFAFTKFVSAYLYRHLDYNEKVYPEVISDENKKNEFKCVVYKDKDCKKKLCEYSFISYKS